jgi:hypothetical protein
MSRRPRRLPWFVPLLVLAPGCRGEPPPQERKQPTVLSSVVVTRPSDDPTSRDTGVPDPRGEAIRARSIAELTKAGFKPANWLPTSAKRAGVAGKLRPTREIASRLLALHMVSVWIDAPEDAVPSAMVRDFIQRNALDPAFTPAERAILALGRTEANAKHASGLGWFQENMWSLAWLLGYEPAPTPTAPLISDVTAMLRFLPEPDGALDAFLKGKTPRTQDATAELEDLFYCAHNAVRSAQLGTAGAVPAGFDPRLHGGGVHERRHSLTWALSPGVAWDDTDLST